MQQEQALQGKEGWQEEDRGASPDHLGGLDVKKNNVRGNARTYCFGLWLTRRVQCRSFLQEGLVRHQGSFPLHAEECWQDPRHPHSGYKGVCAKEGASLEFVDAMAVWVVRPEV
eukprot:7113287-Pyramimonas_sp.AAC.1